MMALTECFRYRYFSYSYSYSYIAVNGFDLFPLMVISVTVNVNHTDALYMQRKLVRMKMQARSQGGPRGPR